MTFARVPSNAPRSTQKGRKHGDTREHQFKTRTQTSDTHNRPPNKNTIRQLSSSSSSRPPSPPHPSSLLSFHFRHVQNVLHAAWWLHTSSLRTRGTWTPVVGVSQDMFVSHNFARPWACLLLMLTCVLCCVGKSPIEVPCNIIGLKNWGQAQHRHRQDTDGDMRHRPSTPHQDP